jgi:hypothetical protein
MTNESVRDGASPRGPKTGDEARLNTEPATADATPATGPAAESEPGSEAAAPAPVTDWLAPPEPAPAATADWLATEDEAGRAEDDFEPEDDTQAEADFEPEPPPGFEPEGAEFDEEDEADEEQENEAEAPALTVGQRLRRISPVAVILGIAAIGSLGFLLAQLASHTAPINVLISISSVTGVIYAACAVVGAVASYRAAIAGRTARAFALAFVGGSAAIVACGAFAGAALLYLALGF